MLARHALVAALSLAALAFAGCALDANDPSAPATPEGTSAAQSESLTSFGRAIVGSYTRVDGAGAPTHLTLNRDGSYASETVVMCFRAPCPTQTDAGSWKVSGSPAKGKLRLASDQGKGATTYAAKLLDGGATLRLSAAGLTQRMSRDPVPQICGGIAALACPAGSECVYAQPTYPDAAGTCVPRGGLGTSCGGIAALPCDAGLVCTLDATPGMSDPMGICTQP